MEQESNPPTTALELALNYVTITERGQERNLTPEEKECLRNIVATHPIPDDIRTPETAEAFYRIHACNITNVQTTNKLPSGFFLARPSDGSFDLLCTLFDTHETFFELSMTILREAEWEGAPIESIEQHIRQAVGYIMEVTRGGRQEPYSPVLKTAPELRDWITIKSYGELVRLFYVAEVIQDLGIRDQDSVAFILNHIVGPDSYPSVKVLLSWTENISKFRPNLMNDFAKRAYEIETQLNLAIEVCKTHQTLQQKLSELNSGVQVFEGFIPLPDSLARELVLSLYANKGADLSTPIAHLEMARETCKKTAIDLLGLEISDQARFKVMRNYYLVFSHLYGQEISEGE